MTPPQTTTQGDQSGPVDGSDEATAAARRGLALAKDFDATAEAVYVVEQRALALTRTDPESARLRDTASRSSRRRVTRRRHWSVVTTELQGGDQCADRRVRS
ncbi:hypothetical protein C9J85_15975 [Haloferax sp. wsp5]|nr:hypothetical protein C9J85_15975 [Haloferax sp. wsp5]